MIIHAIDLKQQFDLDTGNRSGQLKLICPACVGKRKNKKDRSLSWNTSNEVGNCHHCGERFLKYKKMEVVEKERFVRVNWENHTELSDKAVKWFEGRMISQKTLSKMGVCSKTEYMPQTGKEESVICFPFMRDGEVVNVKYRDGHKNFKLVKGAEKILYNFNAIADAEYLIITEGEIDALTFIELGLKNVVSVPNGASTNTEYLDGIIESISEIEKVYIAADNDEKGLALREELSRRIGLGNCFMMDFGDCKDANEVLCKHGPLALREIKDSAQLRKLDGVFTCEDFEDEIDSLFETGLQPGKLIGIEGHDKLISFETKRLAIVTGIPNHGKSEYVDFLVSKLNTLHGWKAAYFSPENAPVEVHFSKIAEKHIGKRFKKGIMTMDEINEFKKYAAKNYQFIKPKDDWTVENIIEKAKYCVKMFGSKIFVIDAYNKLEHKIPQGMTETNYISKMLDDFIQFGVNYNSLVILVAHPRKMPKDQDGLFDVPNLYSVAGSANFYNKADYGIAFYRHEKEGGGLSHNSTIHIQKVKFRHLGATGSVDFQYNITNGRFSERKDGALSTRDWDNSSWGKTYEEKRKLSVEDHNLMNSKRNKDGGESPFI